jgi:hypothetical protein
LIWQIWPTIDPLAGSTRGLRHPGKAQRFPETAKSRFTVGLDGSVNASDGFDRLPLVAGFPVVLLFRTWLRLVVFFGIAVLEHEVSKAAFKTRVDVTRVVC